MTSSGIRPIEVVHRDWRGRLLLSNLDKSVLHEDSGLRGRFRLSDEKLTVLWGNDAPEVFVEVRGKYVHSELLRDVPVVDRLYAVNLNETLLLAKRITLEVPGGDFDVELRLNRRDVEKFEQVFLRSDFASPDLPEDAQAVVDIGANTGLVSVFFGLRYPRSTILAIEYGEEEFSLLTSNTSGLAARMIRRRGLIEPQADELPADIPAPGSADGDASSVAPTSPAVFTLTSALDDARFTGVDILKVDLDPGPLDSFFRHAESWLPRVSMIVVEAGEQILEESRSHVRATLAPAFDELPPVGQNLFFRRRHAGTGRRVGRRSGVHEGGRPAAQQRRPSTLLVAGDSHLFALGAPQGYRGEVGLRPAPDAENIFFLNEAWVEGRSKRYWDRLAAESAHRAVALLCAGHQHLSDFLFEQDPPIDLIDPSSGIEGTRPGARVLARRFVKAHFEPSIDHVVGNLIERLNGAGCRSVTVLGNPPMVADFSPFIAEIRASTTWQGIAESRGIDLRTVQFTPTSVLLKLWNVYQEVSSETAARYGAGFLAVPPQARGPDGFLAADYCDHDFAHANAAYGKLMLEHLRRATFGEP